MTSALILLAFASCLPACFAITAARRAGARGGWLPYAVWVLEESAERLRRAALWLRDFHAWQISRRAEARRAGNWSPSALVPIAASSSCGPDAAMEITSAIAAGPAGVR